MMLPDRLTRAQLDEFVSAWMDENGRDLTLPIPGWAHDACARAVGWTTGTIVLSSSVRDALHRIRATRGIRLRRRRALPP